MSEKKFSSLSNLGELLSDEEKVEMQKKAEKEAYQKKWRKNKFEFRKMIAKKNRKWLNESVSNKENDFKLTERSESTYNYIYNMFLTDERKRKWIIHLIHNFFPLESCKTVPKIPPKKPVRCPITDLMLTDEVSILQGDRDKHLGFTGKKTDVILSGIAVQELYYFLHDCTIDFDSKQGHIVNYALDQIRSQKSEQSK